MSDAAPLATSSPAEVSQAGATPEQTTDTDSVPNMAQPELNAQTPQGGTLSDLDGAATSTVARPQTGDATGLEEAPKDSADAVAVNQEEPVLPNPQALAPTEPDVATQPVVATDTSTPLAPAPDGSEGAFAAPQQPDSDQSDDQVAKLDLPTLEAAQVAPSGVAEAPAALAASPTPALPEADEETAQVTAPETAPDETENAALATPIDPIQPDPGTDAEAAEPATSTVVPVVRSALGTPAVKLTQRASTVTIRRPNEDSTLASTDVVVDNGAENAPDAADDRPISRNSVAFTNTTDKPLMSIVLIDDGRSVTDGKIGLAALRSFPYPLTFAVDTSLADAASRIQTYRDAEFEVMAMIDLPEGATATDAETTFSVILPDLKGVIGVLEGVEGGLQSNREAADQVTAILEQSGHGLVTQDNGLNTMPKLAVKAGVPAAPVFRDFDSKDQDARVIRRFLDQAAFKAGQEGAVIMLGRLRPETITALLLWGLQDRASQVALAPVSAVLRKTQ